MLLDLMDEIDHQQRSEQRAFAGRIMPRQRDPGGDAEDAENGQGLLPVGGEAGQNEHGA
jgi:hypothetical protein